MPSAHHAPLLLLPGFFHGSWCWTEVITHLLAAGRTAVTVDMAGHGLHARRPRSFLRRSSDPEAFRTEPCPMAEVNLDRSAALLTAQIKQIGGGGPVTVVAHSAAGVVLTRVAQQSPDLISHAVYLAAVMPGSDEPPANHTQWPEFADSRITGDGWGVDTANLYHLHRGQGGATGHPGEVHRRGGRGVPRQPYERCNPRCVTLAVSVDAGGRRRRPHQGGRT